MEPGVCIRLWHEGQALDAFDRPEMLEADLTGLALDLTAWGVADPGQLRFLDPPPGPAWAEATSLLKGLSALDEAGRITAAGKALARLPLHPRLAHMVQEAASDGAAGTAALLAVLLGERGLGGEDVDLAARLDRFRREGGRRAEDARRLAEGWARLAGGAAGAQDGAIGIHLARAYPDRVAQAVDGRGRFRLANGRQASLDESEGLARAGFLVVSELSGAAGNARIRGAVAIAREEVEALFADRIAQEVVLGFDRAARAVRARRVRRLGALKLSDQPAAVDDAEAAARLLAEGIAETGIAALPWSREQAGLLKRARYLFATLGAPWPDLSEAALARDKAGWLAPHIMGRTALAEITPEDLSGALEALLPWERRGEIEALLPSHFTVPTGSRIAIDYEAENGPVLAVRVQELFGLDTHPSVAGGRVALLLHLLSPAQRPIQTTRDLPGFWRGSWKDVAKDLRGRYPRHPWPDDPLAAAPTSRAKPRGS
jgi:ATP-dependent helicase HrpB